MKLIKVFLFLVSLGFIMFMVGCNAAKTAERRLEAEGYVVESGQEDEVSSQLNEFGIEDIKNIYLVYDDEDDTIPNAIIVEYDSQNDLADDILDEGQTLDDYKDNVYQNLFVISLEITNVDHIIDIIKGE